MQLTFYADGKGTITLFIPETKAAKLGRIELVSETNPLPDGGAQAKFRMSGDNSGNKGNLPKGGKNRRFQFYSKARADQRKHSGFGKLTYEGDLLVVTTPPPSRKTFKEILG